MTTESKLLLRLSGGADPRRIRDGRHREGAGGSRPARRDASTDHCDARPPRAGARSRGAIGAKAAGVFDRAVMHVPIETAKEARAEAERLRADGYIAVGGGSATGVAKVIALTPAARFCASRRPIPDRR